MLESDLSKSPLEQQESSTQTICDVMMVVARLQNTTNQSRRRLMACHTEATIILEYVSIHKYFHLTCMYCIQTTKAFKHKVNTNGNKMRFKCSPRKTK